MIPIKIITCVFPARTELFGNHRCRISERKKSIAGCGCQVLSGDRDHS